MLGFGPVELDPLLERVAGVGAPRVGCGVGPRGTAGDAHRRVCPLRRLDPMAHRHAVAEPTHAPARHLERGHRTGQDTSGAQPLHLGRCGKVDADVLATRISALQGGRIDLDVPAHPVLTRLRHELGLGQHHARLHPVVPDVVHLVQPRRDAHGGLGAVAQQDAHSAQPRGCRPGLHGDPLSAQGSEVLRQLAPGLSQPAVDPAVAW